MIAGCGVLAESVLQTIRKAGGNMLKQFIACKNPAERFRFFDGTRVSDWTASELEAIASIIGLELNTEAEPAQNYMAICCTLRQKAEKIA